jgi:hypothetical protein
MDQNISKPTQSQIFKDSLHKKYRTVGFGWQTQAMIEKMLESGVLHYLAGIENSNEDVIVNNFKFFLSNLRQVEPEL